MHYNPGNAAVDVGASVPLVQAVAQFNLARVCAKRRLSVY
jgi:hypothetical protein